VKKSAAFISPHIFEDIYINDEQYISKIHIILRNLEKYCNIFVTRNLKSSYRDYAQDVQQLPEVGFANRYIKQFFMSKLGQGMMLPGASIEPRRSPHQGCVDLENLEQFPVSPPIVILMTENGCYFDNSVNVVTPDTFGTSSVYQSFLESENVSEIEKRVKLSIGEITWNKLHKLSKDLLIAGQIDLETRIDRPDLPYNAVVNSFANALENELVRIIDPWKEIVKYNSEYDQHDDLCTKILSKFVGHGNGPTIGNFPHLFNVSGLSDNPFMQSWKQFLQTHPNAAYLTSTVCLQALISATDYRNRADHAGRIPKKESDRFLRLLLGDKDTIGLLNHIVG